MPAYVEKHRYFPFEEELAFSALRENFIASPAPKVLVLDIDETIMASVPEWHRYFTHILKKRGHKGHIPTLEELTSRGGTDYVYNSPEFFTPEEYLLLGAMGRLLTRINRDGPITEPVIAEVLEQLHQNGIETIGSMTSRPNHPRVLASCYSLFDKVGLPKLPVVARPEHQNGHFQSGSWKIDYLAQLQTLDPTKQVIIIDDSISLAKKVAERNQTVTKDQHIVQVLYPGMNSISRIEAGEVCENPERGIFISTWAELLQAMQRIETEYTVPAAA